VVKLHDLRSVLRPESLGDTPTDPPVFVGGEQAVDQALSWLVDYFGEDDNRAVIRVRIGEEPLRYLTRGDFLSLLAPRTKGLEDFGGGDFMTLPGDPSLRPLRFRCPTDGRVYSYYLVDEDNLPTCEDHRGTPLEAIS
jgi:hypothetical protein